MARKIAKTLVEGGTDHSPNVTVDPVDTGDAYGSVPANAARTGDPAVLMTPGSEAGIENAAAVSKGRVIAQIVDKALQMKGDELVNFFSKMFPDDGDPSEVMNAQNINLATVKGNPGAQQAALDTGTVAREASVNAAAGDTTARPVMPSQPAADPAGLSRMAAEEVEAILGGEKLSEATTLKLKTLFESAVAIRAGIVEAELSDEYQAKLEEGVEEAIETIVEQVDMYISEAAKQYLTENKLAVVDTARLAINESFMAKFKELLEDHSIEVTEDTVDIAEAAIQQTEVAEKATNEALARVKQLEEELIKTNKALVVEKASVGLSLDGREKLKVLAESVAYDDTFAEKVRVLKEQRIVPAAKATGIDGTDADRIGFLEEETKPVTVTASDPTGAVSKLAQAMSLKMAANKWPL